MFSVHVITFVLCCLDWLLLSKNRKGKAPWNNTYHIKVIVADQPRLQWLPSMLPSINQWIGSKWSFIFLYQFSKVASVSRSEEQNVQNIFVFFFVACVCVRGACVPVQSGVGLMNASTWLGWRGVMKKSSACQLAVGLVSVHPASKNRRSHGWRGWKCEGEGGQQWRRRQWRQWWWRWWAVQDRPPVVYGGEAGLGIDLGSGADHSVRGSPLAKKKKKSLGGGAMTERL